VAIKSHVGYFRKYWRSVVELRSRDSIRVRRLRGEALHVSGGYWILDDPTVSDCPGGEEAVEDLLIRRRGLNSDQVYLHYLFRQP
jgi:hypothetical protein